MDKTKDAKDKLKKDFDTLLMDAQGLLKATAGDVDDKTKDAREKLLKSIEDYKEQIAEAEESIVETARKVDDCIREKPYQAMGISMAAGIFLGWLMSKK